MDKYIKVSNRLIDYSCGGNFFLLPAYVYIKNNTGVFGACVKSLVQLQEELDITGTGQKRRCEKYLKALGMLSANINVQMKNNEESTFLRSFFKIGMNGKVIFSPRTFLTSEVEEKVDYEIKEIIEKNRFYYKEDLRFKFSTEKNEEIGFTPFTFPEYQAFISAKKHYIAERKTPRKTANEWRGDLEELFCLYMYVKKRIIWNSANGKYIGDIRIPKKNLEEYLDGILPPRTLSGMLKELCIVGFLKPIKSGRGISYALALNIDEITFGGKANADEEAEG